MFSLWNRINNHANEYAGRNGQGHGFPLEEEIGLFNINSNTFLE